jgi:hypothetical protein
VDSAILFSYSFLIAAGVNRRHADRMKYLLPLVLVAAVAFAGCNTQTADNSTTPTTPTAPTITEPAFAGTLSVGQTKVFLFNVTQLGPLTVTLTAAGPPANVTIGLSLGNPTFSTAGTTCTPITQTFSAQVGVSAPQISGTTTTTGAYCLAVIDLGNLTADTTFSVTVAHT